MKKLMVLILIAMSPKLFAMDQEDNWGCIQRNMQNCSTIGKITALGIAVLGSAGVFTAGLDVYYEQHKNKCPVPLSVTMGIGNQRPGKKQFNGGTPFCAECLYQGKNYRCSLNDYEAKDSNWIYPSNNNANENNTIARRWLRFVQHDLNCTCIWGLGKLNHKDKSFNLYCGDRCKSLINQCTVHVERQ